MTEEAEGKTSGQGPLKGEGTPPAETVALSDLLAHKKAAQRREKELKADLEVQTQRVRELENDLEFLKSGPGEGASEDEIATVKKSLVQKSRQLAMRTKELEKLQQSLTQRERDLELKSLCSRYGVEEKEVISRCVDGDDPEKVVLELYAEKLEKRAKQLEKEKQGGSRFEGGSPASASKNIWNMSDAEFEQHQKRLKQEALKR